MIYKFNKIPKLELKIKNILIENIFSNTLLYPYASYDILYEDNENMNFHYAFYKMNETINSMFVSLNNFLIQTHMILKENKGVIKKDDIETGKYLIKDYTVESRNQYSNSIITLLNIISKDIEIDFAENKMYFKIIEILIRNHYSHGWQLILENIYMQHEIYRTPEFTLFINDKYVDFNLLFLEILDSQAQDQEIIKLLDKLKEQGVKTHKEKSDFTEMLTNKDFKKKSFLYQNENRIIFNENASRVFLSRNYYNKYTGDTQKTINLENTKICLERKNPFDENIGEFELSINEVVNQCNLIIKKIDDYFVRKNLKY